MAAIAAFIHCRAGKAIAVERIATRMEEQMNALIPDSAAKHVTSKLVSQPSCLDSAHRPSTSDKDEDWKSDIRHLNHHNRFPVVTDLKEKLKNVRQRQIGQAG